jgi:hypothetical protein
MMRITVADYDGVLGQALDRAWQEAHRQIAQLPRGDERDRLKCAVSLMRKRDRAGELLSSWIERARECADSDDAHRRAFAEGLLWAASGLAGAMDLPIDESVCQHPDRDADHCPTCGWAAMVEDDQESI